MNFMKIFTPLYFIDIFPYFIDTFRRHLKSANVFVKRDSVEYLKKKRQQESIVIYLKLSFNVHEPKCPATSIEKYLLIDF